VTDCRGMSRAWSTPRGADVLQLGDVDVALSLMSQSAYGGGSCRRHEQA
jgi:hypothetical protein